MNSTSRGCRLVSSAARSPALAITGPEVDRKLTPSSRDTIWASVVSPPTFAAIVLMVMVTTMVTPPLLAIPFPAIDPVLVGSQIVVALQALVSRRTDPLDSSVISITQFHAGSAGNVIPEVAELYGTVRTLRPETQDLMERLIAQVARLCGAGQLIVVEPLGYRRDLALELGADVAVASHGEVKALTDGRGVDVVLEATTSPLGPQHAAEAVRIGGKLVLVGIPDGDAFTLNASLVRRKGLTIKLSRRMGHVYPRAIEMVGRGQIDLKAVMSHTLGLEGTPEAFAMHADYRDGVVKSVVFPFGDD